MNHPTASFLSPYPHPYCTSRLSKIQKIRFKTILPPFRCSHTPEVSQSDSSAVSGPNSTCFTGVLNSILTFFFSLPFRGRGCGFNGLARYPKLR